MSEHFIPLNEGSATSTGILLAINPANVSHIESVYAKEEYQLRIHMLNSRFISVAEEDIQDTLEALGLGELLEDSEDEEADES